MEGATFTEDTITQEFKKFNLWVSKLEDKARAIQRGPFKYIFNHRFVTKMMKEINTEKGVLKVDKKNSFELLEKNKINDIETMFAYHKKSILNLNARINRKLFDIGA